MSVPQKLLMPIVGLLAGCLGMGIGMLARQPEINNLQKQVKQLQEKAEELKETVRVQNDELSALIARYQALKAWQLFQKSDLREKIRDSLTFQYAMYDYFTLMLERLETGRDFQDDELAFYSAFSLMLDGKRLNAEQMEVVKSYVFDRHEKQIKASDPCDVSEIINRIQNYESCDDNNEGFHLPKIEFPQIELPKLEMPELNFSLPWEKRPRE